MEKDYQTLLDRLHAGEITEFKIETAEFMDFQKILLNYNYRKNVLTPRYIPNLICADTIYHPQSNHLHSLFYL